MLPLLPRHGIQVWVRSGDGPRFVARFRSVWQRVPLTVRRRVLRFWRALGIPGAPIVKLAPLEECSAEPGREAGVTFGVVHRNGYAISFDSVMFGLMPDDVAEVVIAHELAHVNQCTGPLPDPSIREAEADARIAQWGFSPDRLHEWIREQTQR